MNGEIKSNIQKDIKCSNCYRTGYIYLTNEEIVCKKCGYREKRKNKEEQ